MRSVPAVHGKYTGIHGPQKAEPLVFILKNCHLYICLYLKRVYARMYVKLYDCNIWQYMVRTRIACFYFEGMFRY